MEVNRDDFVIAIRSAFLKKGTKQIFSLIALIFFSIAILVLGKYDFKATNILKLSIKEVVYRSSFIVSVPENFIKRSYNLTIDHFNLYNNYKELKRNYDSLLAKQLNTEFIKSENKILKSKIEDTFDPKLIVLAKVLIDKQSPFLKSVIINRGSKDGIKLGMAVLDGEFLAGKVVEVNYSTSRILLLSDLNSKVPVSVEPNAIQSILSGTGESKGILQYVYNENYLISDQDEVFTSGSGEIFLPGIPIGKVELLNGELKIRFHSDFSQLRLVKIVSFKITN